jgi:hypothetical protein
MSIADDVMYAVVDSTDSIVKGGDYNRSGLYGRKGHATARLNRINKTIGDGGWLNNFCVRDYAGPFRVVAVKLEIVPLPVKAKIVKMRITCREEDVSKISNSIANSGADDWDLTYPVAYPVSKSSSR